MNYIKKVSKTPDRINQFIDDLAKEGEVFLNYELQKLAFDSLMAIYFGQRYTEFAPSGNYKEWRTDGRSHSIDVFEHYFRLTQDTASSLFTRMNLRNPKRLWLHKGQYNPVVQENADEFMKVLLNLGIKSKDFDSVFKIMMKDGDMIRE